MPKSRFFYFIFNCCFNLIFFSFFLCVCSTSYGLYSNDSKEQWILYFKRWHLMASLKWGNSPSHFTYIRIKLKQNRILISHYMAFNVPIYILFFSTVICSYSILCVLFVVVVLVVFVVFFLSFQECMSDWLFLHFNNFCCCCLKSFTVNQNNSVRRNDVYFSLLLLYTAHIFVVDYCCCCCFS